MVSLKKTEGLSTSKFIAEMGINPDSDFGKELLNLGGGLTDDIIEKISQTDFNVEDNWTIFEIKHLGVLMAEYQDDNKGVYISIKSGQYEGEVAALISFNKDQAILKTSGAINSIPEENFITLPYAKDYLLQLLDIYVDKGCDAVIITDKASLTVDLY